ncbi:zinc finger homeobox protein 4 [Trichonephila inaurata madagascariensis]|uniref:Zinc finger homeobox protein 4 n=1 Tax=Trichonephila inaurata madagascariensis TaxID=2747483 RepID=A0A8X6ITD4_9ARAC|nr:zinc finger homeobox protein 4 [Trichonephila inaurata madagascariensis]
MEGDLKARLIDETSMENLTENETVSVSTIDKQSLADNMACGIEDISNDSTESYSISDRSFNETSHEDVKNVRYGECATTEKSSSPVCEQEGNSKKDSLNISNLETSTHRHGHYSSGTFTINCDKIVCSDCNLTGNNLGLTREQEHDKSKEVLQGSSDNRDQKSASPTKVSYFATQINNFFDKYFDSASSNSTPTSFGKYLPPSYNSSYHNKVGTSSLNQIPSIETLLPSSNPYTALLDSRGTPTANPYNVTGAICKPTLLKCKENEAVNLSRPNHSPGTSAPSISVKRPAESKIKEQNKRFPACEYVTNSDSDLHMHQAMHAYPIGGLEIDQINAFQNLTNVNAMYWRSNGRVNLGVNPRFRNDLFQHSTSNEHNAAEHRLLTEYGARNSGGIYIMKETRHAERKPVDNFEANTIPSTNATNQQSVTADSEKKTRKYPRSPLHQNEARESTKKVSDNTKIKEIGSQEMDSPLNVKERGPLCPARFSNSSDCQIHFTEVHEAGNYSALTSLCEMVAEKQLPPGNKKVTGTFKCTNTATDAKQNSATSGGFLKGNRVPSELNSNTDNSESSNGLRKPTQINLDSTTNRTDENLTEHQKSHLKNKTSDSESEGFNFTSSASSQNNDEKFVPLSACDIYSNSDCSSESSDIDVG